MSNIKKFWFAIGICLAFSTISSFINWLDEYKSLGSIIKGGKVVSLVKEDWKYDCADEYNETTAGTYIEPTDITLSGGDVINCVISSSQKAADLVVISVEAGLPTKIAAVNEVVKMAVSDNGNKQEVCTTLLRRLKSYCPTLMKKRFEL